MNTFKEYAIFRRHFRRIAMLEIKIIGTFPQQFQNSSQNN